MGVKGILDNAQRALASKSEAELLAAYETRYKDPARFFAAVKDFDDCRWWRDAVFLSLAHYGAQVVPNGSYSEWQGWVVLARIEPGKDIIGLVRQKRLRLEPVSHLKDILTRYNYRTWLFLCLHVGPTELRVAAKEWRKMARTGYRGDVVFIPLWVPEPEYREIFDGSNPAERPWDVIKRGLLAERDQ
jgi:hypothetical protein